MSVGQYSGMLALKSTSSTRWYIDIPIPKIISLHERLNEEGTHFPIEWQGSTNARNDPIDTTLYALDKEDLHAIINKHFNLKITVTKVNNPHDWWFYSCPKCWKKIILVGNSRKCPDCGGKQEQHRYKLSVNAVDIEPNPENKEIIGQFAFLGNSGTAFTGKEAVLLAASTRGRPDFIPPAIANTVGKQYIVTVEVKQDTLNAEEGMIILRVSRVQPINLPAPAQTSSNNPCPPTINKIPTLLQAPANTDQLEADKSPQATPVWRQPGNNLTLQATPMNEAIEPAEIEPKEDTTGKKRKNMASESSITKKKASEKGPAKELFPTKQKK